MNNGRDVDYRDYGNFKLYTKLKKEERNSAK